MIILWETVSGHQDCRLRDHLYEVVVMCRQRGKRQEVIWLQRKQRYCPEMEWMQAEEATQAPQGTDCCTPNPVRPPLWRMSQNFTKMRGRTENQPKSTG